VPGESRRFPDGSVEKTSSVGKTVEQLSSGWLTAGVEAIYAENARLLPFVTRLLPCLTVLASLERVVLQGRVAVCDGISAETQFLSSRRSANHSAVSKEKLHERSSV
jgi:hypothetical protein